MTSLRTALQAVFGPPQHASERMLFTARCWPAWTVQTLSSLAGWKYWASLAFTIALAAAVSL